jgi:hypothetical protein
MIEENIRKRMRREIDSVNSRETLDKSSMKSL